MYKVSALIPVYKVKDYIERCLISICENTIIEDCEIILLNDKSPDNSFEIAREVLAKYPRLKSNIKFIEHTENTGIAQTRNDLLNEASGEYFIFIDSDDYIEKTYLEDLYNSAKSSDADIVECDYYIHDLRSNLIKCYCNVEKKSYNCIISKLLGKNCAYLFVKLIRTSLVKENDLHFIPGMNLCEDEYFTYCIYCYANTINYVPKHLYHYVLNKESITRTLFDDNKIRSVIDCVNFSTDLLLKHYNNQEIKECISFRKMNRKGYILLNTTRKNQRKLRNLWKEDTYILKKRKINPILKTIVLGKNRILVSIYLVIIMLVKKIKNRNFTLKDFLN